jgi:hypothetical protein
MTLASVSASALMTETNAKFTRLLEDFSWGPISEVLSGSWSEAKSKCEVSDGL